VKIFKFAKDLSQYLIAQGKENIGFVPTMGALHQGHTSLITLSKKENGITVCSIFVNPTQFNNPKDLEKYPRTIEKDIDTLLKADCDVLYLPEINDVYPNGTQNLEHFNLSPLDSILEGASRPGHFQGVAVVVKRLFDIVNPTRAYFGQKDFQQVMVIKKMVEVTGLKVEMKSCPIVREANGLAMSSRNVRLTTKQRQEAGKIYEALQYVKANYYTKSLPEVLKHATEIIQTIEGSRIDYIKVCDRNTLTEITSPSPTEQSFGRASPVERGVVDAKNAVCLVAVYVGEVRLIDNEVLS
jgi:pantoate--beta-alanine ligase